MMNLLLTTLLIAVGLAAVITLVWSWIEENKGDDE